MSGLELVRHWTITFCCVFTQLQQLLMKTRTASPQSSQETIWRLEGERPVKMFNDLTSPSCLWFATELFRGTRGLQRDKEVFLQNIISNQWKIFALFYCFLFGKYPQRLLVFMHPAYKGSNFLLTFYLNRSFRSVIVISAQSVVKIKSAKLVPLKDLKEHGLY